MRFQMGPQIASLRGFIIALVAFVWFFPTVGSQMCPQMTDMGGCVLTLVAFVCSFILNSFNIHINFTPIRTFKVIIHHYFLKKKVSGKEMEGPLNWSVLMSKGYWFIVFGLSLSGWLKESESADFLYNWASFSTKRRHSFATYFDRGEFSQEIFNSIWGILKAAHCSVQKHNWRVGIFPFCSVLWAFVLHRKVSVIFMILFSKYGEYS